MYRHGSVDMYVWSMLQHGTKGLQTIFKLKPRVHSNVGIEESQVSLLTKTIQTPKLNAFKVDECGAACRWKISLLQGVQASTFLQERRARFWMRPLVSSC